jgi:hypothetical protein
MKHQKLETENKSWLQVSRRSDSDCQFVQSGLATRTGQKQGVGSNSWKS